MQAPPRGFNGLSADPGTNRNQNRFSVSPAANDSESVSLLMSTLFNADNAKYCNTLHDDVIKWEHFPRSWHFLWRIHRSPVNSPHKSQWRGAVMFSLTCAWLNGWVNNREAGELRRHRDHYDVIIMRNKESEVVTYMGALRKFADHVFSIYQQFDRVFNN